jgi:hypothetical protein
MSFWTGTHWEPESPASKPPPRPSRTRHGLEALAEGTLVALLVVGLVAGTAFAGKGNGRGGGNQAASTAGCSVDGNVVTGRGLPTDQVLNFFMTDSSGKEGWVLGFTDDGTWTERVPDRSGRTTYEFASRTWGPNGSHYDVFASCSAG